MNKVILVGRLCQDPELKYLGEKNIAVTRFTLAVNRSYKNAQGEHDTDFINCEVWNRQAEVFSEYMTKGRLVYIEGKVKVDKYLSTNGENRKDTDFINCEVWNRQAEVFSEYMTKGRLVYIEGKVKVDKYLSTNGENRKSIIVNCDLFRFIDYKQSNKIENTFNSKEIFTDEVFDDNICESEIPF